MNNEQADMEADPDEEEIQDMITGNEREHHWRIIFKDRKGGVGDEKLTIYANRWDVYINDK